MKLSFLGTGTSQGIPVIACQCEVCRSGDQRDKRLRSSVLIEKGDQSVIIDTGPDFRQQMLRIDNRRLDAVLFTHAHRDHIAGLDDIRSYNYVMDRPMDVYAEEKVVRSLRNEFPYIFAERKYPGIPQVNIHHIGTDPFDIGDTRIVPVRVLHYRLPVLGFRIGDFAYITDANKIPDEEMHKLKDLDVLTVCALRKKEHISHFNLAGALEVISAVKPRTAYLTHMSHEMGLHEAVENELPPNVHLAYDGLELEL